jgi:Nuclease-related domain
VVPLTRSLLARALDGLRERGWFALHDVQLDRGNIDHVLIGRAGIFTIETKSHCGRLRAGAIDSRMLKQAYAQAKSVERITGLRAVPLLVFSSAYLIPAVSERRGVVILPSRIGTNSVRRRCRSSRRNSRTVPL